MKTMIEVENVSKKFRLYYDRPLSIKERIVTGSKGVYKEFYAIKDVSFKIKKGSTVGLIGQNGSGKSTMLKMINRTMFPDQGKIKVKGKVASLIELGAGFHPDLSGRENIYNNASVFGFTREEIKAKIPGIIRFSELEGFIDNPIRTYSSGMYARLAFSVAIHVDADILLVDEILGVGDINFQAKCANKIYEMRKQGTTILMVTHDMSTIDRLCDYAIWLEKGKKISEGEPKDIQYQYLEFMAGKQEERRQAETSDEIKKDKIESEVENGVVEKNENRRIEITHLGDHFGNGDLIFTDFKMINSRGTDKRSFYTGESITAKIFYQCQIPPEKLMPNVGLEIYDSQGRLIYGSNTAREGLKNIQLKAKGEIDIKLENLQLLPGDYTLGVAVADVEETGSYDHYHNIAQFKIYSNSHDIGYIRVQHKFIIDGMEIESIFDDEL